MQSLKLYSVSYFSHFPLKLYVSTLHGTFTLSNHKNLSSLFYILNCKRAVFPAAALGSFRWPPYLVAVWVVVLVLTHVLHCLVTVLERALPSLK